MFHPIESGVWAAFEEKEKKNKKKHKSIKKEQRFWYANGISMKSCWACKGDHFVMKIYLGVLVIFAYFILHHKDCHFHLDYHYDQNDFDFLYSMHECNWL